MLDHTHLACVPEAEKALAVCVGQAGLINCQWMMGKNRRGGFGVATFAARPPGAEKFVERCKQKEELNESEIASWRKYTLGRVRMSSFRFLKSRYARS
jgi:hypothetical protein